MNFSRAALAVLLASLVALAGVPAFAAIGLAPITLTLSARAPISSFTITNNEPVEKLVQTQVFEWSQKDGQDVYTKTDDIIVSPPVFNVPADDRQVIRIGTRKRNVPTERAYRIIFTESPGGLSARIAMSVQFHVVVPIFVQPIAETSVKPEWTLHAKDSRHVVFQVKNASSAHLHITNVVFRDGKQEVASIKDAQYVLTGETSRFAVELNRPLESKPLAVDVTTDSGSYKLSLSVTQ